MGRVLAGKKWALLIGAAATLALSTFASARPDPAAGAAEKNQDQWCFAWLPGAKQERAGLLKAARWPSNSTISVTFLDGDPQIQRKVMRHAKTWTREVGGPARLSFELHPNDPEANVRISFRYDGSWSVLGKSSRSVPAGQATMNYGWLKPDTPEEEVRRVVLHEFGHALGLIHEHQNPAGGIQWNQVEVVKDLSGPPNNWDIIEWH